jgi:hypothetical protein
MAWIGMGCANGKSVPVRQDIPRLLDKPRLDESGQIVTFLPKEIPQTRLSKLPCLSFITCSPPNYCTHNKCDSTRRATVHVVYTWGDQEETFICPPHSTTKRSMGQAISVQLVDDQPV